MIKSVSDQEFQSLIELLPKLSQNQLDQLGARLKFLSQGNKLDHISPRSEFMQAIKSELIRRGVMSQQNIPDIVLKKLVPDYKDRLMAAEQFLVDRVKTNSTPQRMLVFKNAAEILADYLIERQIPIGLRTMVLQTRYLPSILNQAFPGYACAGLLSMVLADKRRR